MKRFKLKLEKAIEIQSKIKFPIEDTMIASVDKKGNAPLSLPPVVQKLSHVPDALVGDVLYVWDFLTVFSKQLNLQPILIDDFVDLLHYRATTSPALVEIFVALLRRIYHDHSLANTLAAGIPAHLNILSRSSEEEAKQDLFESQTLEQYRDWEYNGLKLVPKKIHRPEIVVDALKFQCLLRAAVPRLPSYVELLRANDPQLDALISMENREGVDKDGYKGPNRDTLRSLTTNYAHELRVVNEALRLLETKEIHQLGLQHKLILLGHLCRACYDTHDVQDLLVHNQDERLNQLSQMTKHVREERKKLNAVTPELKEEALEECRAMLRLKQQEKEAAAAAESNNKSSAPSSKNKSKGKSQDKVKEDPKDTNKAAVLTPTASQVAAMIEELKLRKAINIDVLIDNNMGNVEEEKAREEAAAAVAAATSTISMTARTSLAEMDRKRKEKERIQLMKEDAIAWLDQALETERERDIKEALKYARLADLEGKMADGRTFCTTQMFKVYRKRAQLEAASREARVASEHEKALAQYFIRTEPLGYDRHHRAYWCFEGDTRVFVQTTLTPDELPIQPVNLSLNPSSSHQRTVKDCTAKMEVDEEEEEEEEENEDNRLVQHSSAGTPLRDNKSPQVSTHDSMLANGQLTPAAASASAQGGILQLSGKTTIPSSHLSPPPTATRNNTQLYASKPSNIQHTWRIYGSMLEIWMLVEALDERGIREKELKSKLRAQFGMNKGGSGETYSSTGSEYIGRKIRRTFGRKVAYGTIVGWLPPDGDDEALWHVVHDDGDEEDLDLKDIKLAFKKEDEALGQANADQKQSSQESAATRKSSRFMNSETDEGVESEEEDEVPEIVSSYVNSVVGGLGVNEKQIGLSGLRSELLRYESMLLEGLKRKGSSFNREGKRQWEHAVKTSENIGDLRACLMTLEEVIHDTQEEEDEIDSKDTKNKKEVMLSDGWIFDPLDCVVNETSSTDITSETSENDEDGKKVLQETRLQYQELVAEALKADKEHAAYAAELEAVGTTSKTKQAQLAKKAQKAADAQLALDEFKEGLKHLQVRIRRFFEGHGASDGIVVAYLPAHLNEGVRLWHLEHDDGDTEDLDLPQIIRGQRYYASNAQEADDDDIEEEEPEDDEDNENDLESAEEESESEEEEDDEGGHAKLWPSLNVRSRWIHATKEAVTIGEVSLALMSLIGCARGYGVVGEDPLAGAQGSRSSKEKAASRVRASSSGSGKRKHSTSGGHNQGNSKRAKTSASVSKKSSSKKAGGGRDYSNRGGRSLLDRATKRCVMSYAEH